MVLSLLCDRVVRALRFICSIVGIAAYVSFIILV